jgi:CheY-like chemotaxis protein
MEAIGRLAGGVAHDFNNLLTLIKGYSHLSLIELDRGNPVRRNIEEIQKASERAADLTRQLLTISRRQIMEMKVLDLRSILQDLEKMLRRIIGGDIELIMKLPDDLGKVKIDPIQIEQAVLNLTVNAKDAMPNGGTLIIELADEELDEQYPRFYGSVCPGSYVRLSVSDTGIGMSPEVRDHIFEPFFTTKEKGKGTGLGLSAVYGIVKQSQGDIQVYSEPGHGTTFRIYLQRTDAPLEELGQKTKAEHRPGGNETVLLVEDDEEVRMLALQVLYRQGYKVLEASQGKEASLICEGYRGPIHLMVTDVVMPGMNGPELAEKLLSLRREMKILFMSGYTANAIGYHNFFKKRVHYIQGNLCRQLARKVREVLDEERWTRSCDFYQ